MNTTKRILVVEDDLDLMNVLTRLTKVLDAEIEVDWAVDVEGALARLGECASFEIWA